MNPIVNSASYSDGKKVANVAIDDIRDVLQHDTHQFVWIGLHEPDNETLKKVQYEFELHDLAIEDALRAHQRPKIELYGSTLFIVLRTVEVHGKELDLGETHFFVGQNFIITIRHGSTVAYKDVRSRCESTPHLLKKGPGFALYAVMDSIVDQYFPVITALEEKLDSLEQTIFEEKHKRRTTEEIYHLKRQLLEVKRSISPLIEICNRLLRFDLKVIDEETRPYFRDVYDHTMRINEMVDNARELLSTALEANLSLISISQNEVSKRFAGWAAIIGIPTMVAGIYGMNFRFMPELDWKFGYPVILLTIVGLCGGLYLHFKRSDWL